MLINQHPFPKMNNISLILKKNSHSSESTFAAANVYS